MIGGLYDRTSLVQARFGAKCWRAGLHFVVVATRVPELTRSKRTNVCKTSAERWSVVAIPRDNFVALS